jgi:excisionase family DNA binding protein
MPTLDLKYPSKEETRLAGEVGRKLAAHMKSGKPLKLRFVDKDADDETLELPAIAVRLMLDALAEMAGGNAVTLMPVEAELTTQQAADLLNVSRPYVVQLLEDGKIPHRMVGSHQRVRYVDVITYKSDIDAKRRQVLDELAAHDQKLGLH